MTEKPKKAHPFVMMLKPVGSLCNMKCSFCYYLKPEANLNPRMSYELLEIFIRQYIEASPGPVLSFTWHGGEPSLAGLDFYRRAVELQKKYLPEGWTCWNNLQTNGLLLDHDFCSFLKEENFDLGLSVDGTIEIHDKHRKDNRGLGTYEKVLSIVELLKSHGIKPDILCTVNSDTVKRPLDVYNALKKLDTHWIQFIPIVNYVNGEISSHSVKGIDYGNFLCKIFDHWLTQDLDSLDVQLFAESLRVAAGFPASLCWMSNVCGRALILEKDGSIYSCDHYVREDYKLGNIFDKHLAEMADSDFQIKFGDGKKNDLHEQCRSCPNLKLCNGGCPKDRSSSGLNYLCEGYMRFFSHALPALEHVVSLRSQGFSSADIMGNINAQLKNIWKGIGRNDPCPCGSGLKAKNCCWDLQH